MSVSHLASSESHTGTTGSISETSFTWNHAPGGVPSGVTVFVWTNGNAGVSLATGVTYDGVTVPPVAGGEASRTTGGQPGNMKAYHLGVAVPATDPAPVIVTRTSTTHTMWACCVTQAANGTTEIYEPGIVLNTDAGGTVEQNVTDGTSRSPSVRYAAGHFAYDAVAPPGANSTAVASMNIDIGAATAAVVVETVPGQGSRPVGLVNVSAEEKAAVSFAVREVSGVAHLAGSESHSGTTGSASQSQFSWTHSPGGTPGAVLVFVWTKNELSFATGVTYGGMIVPPVANGEASRTSGEEGNCKAYFLGANLPSADPATVIVTRQNVSNVMWACCLTASAHYTTEVYAPGIIKSAGAGSMVEVSVDDGSPGTNSQRYAGGFFAYDAAPAAGANSTTVHVFDPGAHTGAVVRETVPGQGLRPVGWFDALAEEKAVVYLALREIIPLTLGDLSVIVYGYLWPTSPIEPLPVGLVVLTADGLHIADVAPIVLRVNPNEVTFTASPDHATVTNYTARLRDYWDPTNTIVNTLSLGVPTPDANGTITVNLAALFAGQPAGDYTVSILTTTPTGSVDSEESNGFTLPVV